jgi:hypothetical protein
MAQNIILKRSGLAGKVPDTGSLNLGEVAINTYDGKVFFKKSGSVESIQEILTTNSTITGSLSMNGTGSFASLQVNDTLTVNHGSTIISGSQLVTDELTVLGAINARQFNISVISSSVIFQSGSTKFGDTLDDTHDFTGSVNITGSFLLNGAEVGGNLPNTYDFNLEQTAAYDFEIETEVEGVVSFVTGDNGNVKIKSNPQTADITINDVTYLSVSTSSVVVAKSLLPDVSGTIDLGSVDKPFRHLYVGTGSIYLVNPQGSVIKQISANTIVTTSDIESGSINLSAALPSGLISNSAQLTSTYDSRYVLSGSITQTTWDNIASKPSGIVSSSSQIDITSTAGYTTFSSSIKTVTDTFPTSASVSSATSNSINTLSGSVFTTYAKLSADNTFVGTQVITGSLYVSSNLIVQGSSSLQNITASAVSIGTNTVILNTANPSVRYGGISVIDSGSAAGKSGSLYFDSTDDEWVFIHQGNEAVTSSVMITGPETYDNLGNETRLTNNRVPKTTNGFHIVDSNISDNGTIVTINSATQITGSLGVTDSTNFSGALTASAGMVLPVNQSITSNNGRIVLNNGSIYLGDIDGVNPSGAVNIRQNGSNFLAYNSGILTITGNVVPDGNGTRDLGSSSLRWGTIYTSDLSLNNGIGDWTIVEGEDDLFLYNNKKGKVYKFALTEVDPNVATPKKS